MDGKKKHWIFLAIYDTSYLKTRLGECLWKPQKQETGFKLMLLILFYTIKLWFPKWPIQVPSGVSGKI